MRHVRTWQMAVVAVINLLATGVWAQAGFVTVQFRPEVAAHATAALRLRHAAVLVEKNRHSNTEEWRMASTTQAARVAAELQEEPSVQHAAPYVPEGEQAQAYTQAGELADYANDAIMVGFHQGVTALETAALRAQFNAQLRHRFTLVNAEIWGVPPTADMPTLLGQVAAVSAVRYAEPSWVVTTTLIPNDPRFGELYGMQRIAAPQAWDTAVGDDNLVVIATIDTGVNYNHEDLRANMWTNPGEIPGNGRDDDNNGWVDDVYGIRCQNNGSDRSGNPMDDHNHGSHCSGTHSGHGNNGVGVAGVMWRARIMGAKFLNSGGSGYISDGAVCLEYTIKMGARLSNNSWGGGGYSQTFADVLEMGRRSNYFFVCAAGNHGGNNDGGSYYPCCYPHDNVMGVAASDQSDNKASFSGYGPRFVEVAAPGVNVLSCMISGYGTMSGTSMATPHAAGCAALLWSVNPELTYQEVMQILIDTSDRLPQWNGVVAANGRLNIAQALTRVGPPDKIPPVIVSITPEDWALTPRNLTMSIVATDNYTVVSVTVNNNAATNIGGVWQYSTTLAPWTNTMMVIARDRSRNMATQTVNYVFIPDTTPPVITSVAPPSGFTTSSPQVPMTISATDNVAVASVTVNGNQAVKSGAHWLYTAPLQFGTNLLTVMARDVENNASAVYVMYIRLDSEAPYISQVTPPSGYATTNYTVPMRVIATDNAGVTRLTVNGEDAVPLGGDEWAYQAALVIGSNAFQLIARDADANAATQLVYYINNHTPFHFVAPGGGHVYPYNSWSSAARDIHTALVAADDGDVIYIADGVYSGQTVTVNKEVTLRRANGTLGGGAVILDGSGVRPCLVVQHAGAVVEGLTLSNGFNTGHGGGLIITAGLVRLCAITGNRAHGHGGGVAIDGGVVSRCMIENNSAYDGGGVRLTGGELQECILRGNVAQNYGGGAKFNSGGSMVSSVVISNHGNFGGGIYFYYGGAITNCTVAANSGSVGPGIRAYFGGRVHNSIVYHNVGGNAANSGSGFAYSYTCATPAIPGEGNLSADPVFINLAGGDARLATNSPCINAGTNAPWMHGRTDAAGLPRIIGGSGAQIVDLGAYEADYLPDESIHYVSTTGRHVWPYITWATAATNIQDAIDATHAGELVLVAAGNYAPAAEVRASSNITVRAVEGAAATVIDAGGLHRVAWVSGGAVLDGFTLTNGYACCGAPRSDCGAGARVEGATLLNCVVAGNHATGCGGGVYALQSALVSNCVIAGNSADEGAGAFAESGARLVACTLAGNLARARGGGAALQTLAALEDSMVRDNLASNHGGGAYLWAGTRITSGSVQGNEAVRGGGVYAVNSNRMQAATIMNNRASRGGGVYAEQNLLLQGGAVTGNTASVDGGGVYANAQALVTGVFIHGNVAGKDAGGVYGDSGSVIVGCAIVSNRATADAGGAYLHLSAVRWSVVQGNSGYNGGGIKLPQGVIENTLISGNRAANYGGGVMFDFGGVALNTLFTLNHAPFGGGAYCYYGGALTNCTVSGNSGTSAPGVRCVGGGHVHNTILYHNNGANYGNSGSGWSYTHCCLTPAVAGTGNITDAPQFVNHAAGNYRVAAGSPCINAGATAGWMAAARDLDGFTRVRQGAVDIGAYEFNPEMPFVDITNSNATVAYNVSRCTIAGTNNAHVAGGMTWRNELTGEQGSVAASPAWQISGIAISYGANVIRVIGTNRAGEAACDSVTITRQARPFDAPYVAITNHSITVPYETATTGLGGTNNQYVTGGMHWRNSAGGEGTLAAMPVWVIPVIPLAPGANEITVTVTNSAGLADSSSVVITRRSAETGIPFVDITMPDMVVPYGTATLTLQGTNNASVVGWMGWEVYLGPDTVGYGSVPAQPAWSIPNVPLDVGENEVIVWGTNALGHEAWDILYVTRRAAGEEPLEWFTIRLGADYATPVLSWSNELADVLACTNRYYTTDPAAWFTRAVNVQPPWSDPQGTNTPAVYYRIVSGERASAYDVGKLTLHIRQSDGQNTLENWISSPFDFIDETGMEVESLPFDTVGVHRALNEEAGAPARRDSVVCQPVFGGGFSTVSRGNGRWIVAGNPTLTNWYRTRMYKLVINRVHRGAPKPLTLYGKVSQYDPARVARVAQADGVSHAQTWCVAWYPWVVPFAQAALESVVTGYGGVPARRDAVFSQPSPGGSAIHATRGTADWVTTTPAATNLYPGHGYIIRINRNHKGPARDWYQPRGAVQGNTR